MNDLLRIFLLFAIAVVAFSQYLRTSATIEVDAAKERLRAFVDFFRNSEPELRERAQNHSEVKDIREKLYSDECKVPNDTGWYYVIFFYLAFMIAFGSIEKFFTYFSIKESWLIKPTYTYNQEITGMYVLIGLIICFMVFRAGFKAIKPKSEAKRISDNIDSIERIFAGFSG